MKEAIESFIGLTEEKINQLDLEKLYLLRASLELIDEEAEHVWDVFTGLDTDRSEERILEIIKNHASGKILGQMNDLRKLTQFFLSGSPVVINEAPSEDLNEDKNLRDLQQLGRGYLMYRESSVKLDEIKSLVDDRIKELSPVMSNF